MGMAIGPRRATGGGIEVEIVEVERVVREVVGSIEMEDEQNSKCARREAVAEDKVAVAVRRVQRVQRKRAARVRGDCVAEG